QDPSARVETLRTIAQVQEEDLKDQGAAFESLLLALNETPEAGDLYADLERLALGTKGWARFAEVLRQRAGETFDSEVAADMWVRLGVLYEERLDQKEE